MIKLTIKKSDGSIYSTMGFSSQDECDKWLAEEKKKKYWDPSYTTSTEDTAIKEASDEVERMKDINYARNKAMVNRRREYPSLDDTMDAMIDKVVNKNDTKMNDIIAKRAAVDLKYPMP